jgi:predicted XRE-type DNA-binding protein
MYLIFDIFALISARPMIMDMTRRYSPSELIQSMAGKRITQPCISDLTRGKISRFSVDTLVNMLADAGLEVDMRIKARSRRVA